MARPATPLMRHVGVAAEVTGSQLALAASGYLVLIMAAHALPAAGFAALSSFYLLVNTVGRGTFAAVELELTRAVAHTRAVGSGERALRAAAMRRTVVLAVAALLLVAACTPLLAGIVDAEAPMIGLLGAGAVAMAAGYHLRGLLAGRRSYHAYAASYWLEAVLALVLATTLLVAGITSLIAWAAVFVVPALVAAGLVAVARRAELLIIKPAGGADGEAAEPVDSTTRRELGWSALLLLASQGVWNLGPVIVTARLADDPSAAAAFVAAAIVLRAPVLVFPAMQALLLPRLTAKLGGHGSPALDHALARFNVVLAVAAVTWLLAAVSIVPELTKFVFGVPNTPSTVVLLLLALSTVIAAAAQLTQTRLLAARQQHTIATTWLVGLGILLLIAALLTDPQLAGAAAQLASALVVAGTLTMLWRRWNRRLEPAA